MRNFNLKKNIVIISKPIGKSGMVPLSNLINLLHPLSHSLCIIAGNMEKVLPSLTSNNLNIFNIRFCPRSNLFLKIKDYIELQLVFSYYLYKRRKSADICIFFYEAHELLIPVMLTKLFKCKDYFILTASISKSTSIKNNKLGRIFIYSEKVALHFSDKLILYSPNLINFWNLEDYREKVVFAREHIIDIHKFNILTNYGERETIIGFFGRYSLEKGIFNLIRSMEMLHPEIKLITGGDGPLRNDLLDYIREAKLSDRISLENWKEHNELPDYLNKIKILVIPSYTEGLPNIMLEAMACGTPVLVNPVGAIPDIIKEGKTGFLMENNSPECIAANIIRALEYPDLERIAEDGRRFVEENFTFEKTLEIWKNVLQDID